MKHISTIVLAMAVSTVALIIHSCKPSEIIASKGGDELWSENCGRCHNAPGASLYTNEQWDVIGTHMRMRAHITADETRKIVEFLKGNK